MAISVNAALLLKRSMAHGFAVDLHITKFREYYAVLFVIVSLYLAVTPH